MYENVALIKEVHEHLSTKKAQELTSNYLQKINLDEIGKNRVVQCNEVEIFYVMFVRALMTKEKNIIIVLPFSIVKSITDIKNILENLLTLTSNEKNVLILDTISNELHYKGTICHTIK